MELEQAIRVLQQTFRSVMLRLPVIVGNEAVNFTLDNFRNQGFLGNTFEPWAKRKQGWKKDRRTGRNILIDTGVLRRSVRIINATPELVSIGSDVRYAKAHNEGLQLGFIQSVKAHDRKLTGIATVQSIATRRSRKVRVEAGTSKVQAHTRRINQKLPRRRFMGNSPYLNARIRRVATAEFMKAMRTIKP